MENMKESYFRSIFLAERQGLCHGFPGSFRKIRRHKDPPDLRSCLGAFFSGTNGEERHRAVSNHSLCDGPKDKPLETSSPVSSHHNQVGLPVFDDLQYSEVDVSKPHFGRDLNPGAPPSFLEFPEHAFGLSFDVVGDSRSDRCTPGCGDRMRYNVQKVHSGTIVLCEFECIINGEG